MSKVTARTEESQARAYDLREEIETKLSQAKGICTLICGAGERINSGGGFGRRGSYRGRGKGTR
jgi:hypothetical protein